VVPCRQHSTRMYTVGRQGVIVSETTVYGARAGRRLCMSASRESADGL
jgi:hypothetical protein